MSITLELPATLESELRAAANEQGETPDSWLLEVTRRELARRKEARRLEAVRRGTGMFPMGNSDELLAERRAEAQSEAAKIEGVVSQGAAL